MLRGGCQTFPNIVDPPGEPHFTPATLHVRVYIHTHTHARAHEHIHIHSSICVTWDEVLEITHINLLFMVTQILSLYLPWHYC